MPVPELCNWLIRGDSSRPCIVPAGHKGPHRDAAYVIHARERREANKKAKADYDKNYYKTNKTEKIKAVREYREANKERLAKYHREYQTVNRNKIVKRKRKYYETNKERITERKRQYEQTPEGTAVMRRGKHTRRARKLNAVTGPMPANLVSYLLKLYGATCQGCYCKLTQQSVHIDHVIPLAQGGMHTLWNLQPLCSTCNLSKGDRVPTDEIELLQQFNKVVGFEPERSMRAWVK